MRLIDADKLIEVFEEQDRYLWGLPDKENPHKRAKQGQLNWCINTVRDQPTIPGDQKCLYCAEDFCDETLKWKKINDGWFTFYYNVETGETKYKLEKGDMEVF